MAEAGRRATGKLLGMIIMIIIMIVRIMIMIVMIIMIIIGIVRIMMRLFILRERRPRSDSHHQPLQGT